MSTSPSGKSAVIVRLANGSHIHALRNAPGRQRPRPPAAEPLPQHLRSFLLRAALCVAALVGSSSSASAQFSESFNAGIVPPGWTGTTAFGGFFGVDAFQAHLVGTALMTSPTFVVSAPSILTFSALFRAGDRPPYNTGYVQINGQAQWDMIFFADVTQLGALGSTGWQTVTTPLLRGTYQIRFGVEESNNPGYNRPELFVDDINEALETVAPEPGSLTLTGLGLLVVLAGGAVRQRISAAASFSRRCSL